MNDLIKSKELEFRHIKNFIECIRRSVTEINDFMLYRLTTVSEFGGEEEACKALPNILKDLLELHLLVINVYFVDVQNECMSKCQLAMSHGYGKVLRVMIVQWYYILFKIFFHK